MFKYLVLVFCFLVQIGFTENAKHSKVVVRNYPKKVYALAKSSNQSANRKIYTQGKSSNKITNQKVGRTVLGQSVAVSGSDNQQIYARPHNQYGMHSCGVMFGAGGSARRVVDSNFTVSPWRGTGRVAGDVVVPFGENYRETVGVKNSTRLGYYAEFGLYKITNANVYLALNASWDLKSRKLDNNFPVAWSSGAGDVDLNRMRSRYNRTAAAAAAAPGGARWDNLREYYYNPEALMEEFRAAAVAAGAPIAAENLAYYEAYKLSCRVNAKIVSSYNLSFEFGHVCSDRLICSGILGINLNRVYDNDISYNMIGYAVGGSAMFMLKPNMALNFTMMYKFSARKHVKNDSASMMDRKKLQLQLNQVIASVGFRVMF